MFRHGITHNCCNWLVELISVDGKVIGGFPLYALRTSLSIKYFSDIFFSIIPLTIELRMSIQRKPLDRLLWCYCRQIDWEVNESIANPRKNEIFYRFCRAVRPLKVPESSDVMELSWMYLKWLSCDIKYLQAHSYRVIRAAKPRNNPAGIAVRKFPERSLYLCFDWGVWEQIDGWVRKKYNLVNDVSPENVPVTMLVRRFTSINL